MSNENDFTMGFYYALGQAHSEIGDMSKASRAEKNAAILHADDFGIWIRSNVDYTNPPIWELYKRWIKEQVNAD